MVRKAIAEGDLLFHAVHGVCRVDEVSTEGRAGREVLSYSLVPNDANKMKVRFVVPETEMKISGFHAPVSPKEAHEILEYLKTGDLTADCDEEDQAWVLAKAILTSSQEGLGIKDARKRQMLERSAKGLVGELALVLKMTSKETVASIKKSLRNPPHVSSTLFAALTHASEG